MNYVDSLNEALKLQLRHPWTQDRSGGERVWFLVFDADRLRNVLANKELFRLTTEAAGKRWVETDVSQSFGAWMAAHRYAERYYQRPKRAATITSDFVEHLVVKIKRSIEQQGVDEQTLLVLTGTEALFGIAQLSHITRMIEDIVPGRLLVFFPGDYNEPQYRFLDARDGWNYLAVPITPVSRKGQ